MTSYLRPDEKATQSEIGRAQRRNEDVKAVIQAIPSAAGASRILPFLSEHITSDMALNGISKVMPMVGKFLKNGMNQGLSLKSGLDFLKTELTKGTQKPEPENIESKSTSDQSQNPIERLAPGLHQFITQEVGKGKKPSEALNSAKSQGFLKDIENLSRKLGSRLLDVIDQIYSGQDSNIPSQPSNQAQQQPAEPGQGQQALMAILQKIQQSRGA